MARRKEVIVWSLRFLMAGLFIYAGVIKSIQPELFVDEIEAYRLLPYKLSLLLSLYLPFLEIVAGIALLLPRWSRISSALLIALMGIFLVALLSAWVRGLDIACGCFGVSEMTANYPWLLVRDVMLIGALSFIWKLSPKPEQ